MDAIPADLGYIGESERRREGRLTSIIDQLLSNRATRTFSDVTKSEKRMKGKHRRDITSLLNADVAISSSSASVEQQLPTSTHADNRPKNDNSIADAIIAKTPLSNKARRKKITRNNTSSGVKRERCSPDLETGTGSSRSVSPYSPSSNSFRTRTPSNTGTPNNSCFSPPERFSPGNFNTSSNKLMTEGLHMSRNYSDFMRSLAAKYNNTNPNDYRTSSLISLLDSRAKDLVSGEGSSQSSVFPLLNLPLSSFTSNAAALAARKDSDLALTGSGSGKKERKEEFSTIPALPLCGLVQDTNVHQALPPGFSSSPTMDMSSTQALLSIVRSASARNSQQLDTYFSGVGTPTSAVSMKRPAETVGLSSHIPLDLSASMVKRPYVEPQNESFGRGRFREHSSSRSPAIESDTILKDRQYSPTGRKSPSSRFITDVISAYANAQAEKKATAQPNKVSVAQLPANCRLSCAAHSCSPAAAEVREWSISHVVDFVKSIDLCAEYAQVFQEHSIDGSTLPLLTEEHLTTNMNMKLGPALKLRAALAKKIGHCAICLHCVHCHTESSNVTPPTASQPTISQENQDFVNA